MSVDELEALERAAEILQELIEAGRRQREAIRRQKVARAQQGRVLRGEERG